MTPRCLPVVAALGFALAASCNLVAGVSDFVDAPAATGSGATAGTGAGAGPGGHGAEAASGVQLSERLWLARQ